MLNYIWFGLMAIALVVAAFNGTADAVTKGAVESAGTAVQIAIGLVGIMALWLGIMRIAEAAGLVSLLGRAAGPASSASRSSGPPIAMKPAMRWMRNRRVPSTCLCP